MQQTYTINLETVEQMNEFVMQYRQNILDIISVLKNVHPDSLQALLTVEEVVEEMPYTVEQSFFVDVEQTL